MGCGCGSGIAPAGPEGGTAGGQKRCDKGGGEPVQVCGLGPALADYQVEVVARADVRGLAAKAGMAAVPSAVVATAVMSTAAAGYRAGLWPLGGVLVMPVSLMFAVGDGRPGRWG